MTVAEAAGATCSALGLTGPAGVWVIEEIPVVGIDPVYLKPASYSQFDFDITVRDRANAEITGRVWSDTYMGYDKTQWSYNVDFWVVTEFGAVYSLELGRFVGGGWNIQADAFGIVDGDTCTSLYHSTVMTVNTAVYNDADISCGDKYWLFFEEPSADLPQTAPSALGDLWVMPDVVTPEVQNLMFTQDGDSALAGAFTYDLINFTGSYTLQIDADGDGSYDGPLDRKIALGGSGDETYVWDGLDGADNPIDPFSTVVNARVQIDRTDEFHIVLADVEGVNDGMVFTQIRGNAPGNAMLYWDDTQVDAATKTSLTSPIDGTAGVDSSTGAHGWSSNGGSNPWGNMVAVDNWTYSPVDINQTITLSQPRLELVKSSDASAETRVGDEVTYTVTATNTGSADYTGAKPAVVFDDLSGVLDDAEYNADAVADRSGAMSYAEPLLSWAGALAVGESVELTYTVTVMAGGDGAVRNVAWQPDDPQDAVTPACKENPDATSDEVCAVEEWDLPKLTVQKTADRTELPGIGERVEYEVVVTNAGPGDYTAANPATFVDDLTEVLDDATFDSGTVVVSAGTVSFRAPELSWAGALASGESATVTYAVTYTGEGDAVLENTVCVPASETLAGADACDLVTVPGAVLTQWKSVESSDSPAVAGSVLTYALHFHNAGSAAAAVDSIDALAHVLDDAEVTAEPVASAGLTAARTGETIAITGTVASGEVATVTYQVTVKADGQRGDDIAANFLMTDDPSAPPVAPATPECTPADTDQPNCTVTPIESTPVPGEPTPAPEEPEEPISPAPGDPGDSLATTGGALNPWMLSALVLVPLGAGLLLIAAARRRRAERAEDTAAHTV
ncbi:DUF11 domain-containing protein [Microbacterium esteraromaticum]|uniref:DUF7927 domain-containing protein n=1 Tax=Microbacterium esteraromaticum TaxID=57043 RepID=UPI001A8D66AC|nr:DUF11 domain-containing protein [Microbacterium esteraromaticum]MBN8425511.1 DUF11 domain-containing protein [Microbacterium esteraromaticum]